MSNVLAQSTQSTSCHAGQHTQDSTSTGTQARYNNWV